MQPDRAAQPRVTRTGEQWSRRQNDSRTSKTKLHQKTQSTEFITPKGATNYDK
jgi:hypothetical protein